MFSLSKTGAEFIKGFEGFYNRPYICPAGLKTIGYGHVIKPNEEFKGAISEEVASEIFESDIMQFEQAIRRLIKYPINQYQFDSLVSFSYNLGSAALQRSTLRRKINAGYLIEDVIFSEFMKWVYAAGRKLPGLIKRRHMEATMFFCNS